MSEEGVEIVEEDEQLHIEPDADVSIEDIWISGKPIGKLIHRMQKKIDRLERERDEDQQTIDRLTERVAELEANVDPDPTSKSYDEMDQSERVRKIRIALVEDAQRSVGGKAQMKYKEIQALFENRPSAGYAYKLMRIAGAEEGFEFIPNRPKRIRVNSAGVNDETLFHTANKGGLVDAD